MRPKCREYNVDNEQAERAFVLSDTFPCCHTYVRRCARHWNRHKKSRGPLSLTRFRFPWIRNALHALEPINFRILVEFRVFSFDCRASEWVSECVWKASLRNMCLAMLYHRSRLMQAFKAHTKRAKAYFLEHPNNRVPKEHRASEKKAFDKCNVIYWRLNSRITVAVGAAATFFTCMILFVWLLRFEIEALPFPYFEWLLPCTHINKLKCVRLWYIAEAM